MNQPTPTILLRQRNFFLTAIALTVLSLSFLIINVCIIKGFNLGQKSAFISVVGIVMSIIGVVFTLIICGYGYHMGRRGYLKKYVSYAFVIYTIYYIIVKLICPYIPAIQQFYNSLAPFEKQLYSASNYIISAIVMFITFKGSAMSCWMKWLLSLGFILVIPLAVTRVPFMLFSEAEISAHPVRVFVVLVNGIVICGYLIAAALIYFYYSRRIKKETLSIVA